MLNLTTMAGIITSAIRTRAKPPRPLSIRDIHYAERLSTSYVMYATQYVTSGHNQALTERERERKLFPLLSSAHFRP